MKYQSFILTLFLSLACTPLGKRSHPPKGPQAAKTDTKTGDLNQNDQSSMEPYLGIWSSPCEPDTKNSISSKSSLQITREKWDFVTTFYGYKEDCTGPIPYAFTSTFSARIEGPSNKIAGVTDFNATFVSYSATPLLPLGMETLQKKYPQFTWTLFKATTVDKSPFGNNPLSPGDIRYAFMKIIEDRLCFGETKTQFGESKETRGDKLEDKETCSKKSDRLN